MGFLSNVFKKKEPRQKATLTFDELRQKLHSDDWVALKTLGIDSLELLENIPMNLLHIEDFSSEDLRPLEPLKSAILANPKLGQSLNRVLHTQFNIRYKNTKATFSMGGMAWWWLCKNYTLIDKVTSTIHRGNVHEYMLCSTCICVDGALYEVNYYMAPDIVRPTADGLYPMHLGYPPFDIKFRVERWEIENAWKHIAEAFPNGFSKHVNSSYVSAVHSFIVRTRAGFGWDW